VRLAKRSRSSVPWWRAAVRFAAKVVWEYRQDRGSLMAAAVSFYAIVSFVPLLLLAISVLGYVLGSSDRALHTVLKQAEAWIPASHQAIDGAVKGVIRSRGLLGGVGLFGVLWTGLGGLVTLQEAINTIWGVTSRGFVRSRLVALGMLLAAAILLLLSMGATYLIAAVSSLGTGWARQISQAMSPVWRVAVLALPPLVSIALFTLIYLVFPNTKVRVKAALAGGVFAGIAWELAKTGYAWYMVSLAKFGHTYGTLGSIIGLFMGMYYSSLVVLMGAEIAWACQAGSAPSSAGSKERRAPGGAQHGRRHDSSVR